MAHAGWSEGVRGRAQAAGAPQPGVVDDDAGRTRAETQGQMAAGAAEREARRDETEGDVRDGQAEVEAELDKPLARHATESVPGIGGWLAGKLFGTAENEVPDGISRRADQ